MKINGKTIRRFYNLKTLLCFEALHKSIFVIILLPLVDAAIQLALKASRYSYITLRNLLPFSTSPVTLLALLILLSIATFLFYVEFVTLYQFYYSNQTNGKMYVAQIFFPGIKQSIALFTRKGNKLLPLFCTVNYVVYSLPLFIGMLSQQRILSNVVKNITSKSWVIPSFVLFLIGLIYLCYRGMFAIPYCCYDGVSLREGFRMSKQTLQGNKKSIFITLITRNLILCAIYVVMYYAIIIICGVIIFFAVKDSLATVTFLTTYDQINRYYSLAAGILGVLVNIKVIFSIFLKYRITNCPLPDYVVDLQEKIAKEALQVGNHKYWARIRRGRYSRIIVIISTACFAILSTSLVFRFSNSLFRQRSPLFGSYITAHRGYSAKFPENTLLAVQEAIDAKSDYVEIDVQETKDGVVILLHDTNLKRTTGVNRYIWNVTYEEIKTYDAGKKSREIYRNTPIPSLEEVLILCQNTVFLNIEIKINNHEQQLVEEVVRLIEEYHMENQCVISSTNYSALRRVKEANDSIKTGYIMSLAYGYFYNREYVDFFSIKSSFITQDMVRIAHSYGKEIHAWTVNGVSEIQRMKQLGVDNIITDYPIRVREILYEDKLTSSFIVFLRTLTQ